MEFGFKSVMRCRSRRSVSLTNLRDAWHRIKRAAKKGERWAC